MTHNDIAESQGETGAASQTPAEGCIVMLQLKAMASIISLGAWHWWQVGRAILLADLRPCLAVGMAFGKHKAEDLKLGQVRRAALAFDCE